MRAELERIWLETGKTVVFVTHDIDEALQLADRTVVLSNKPTRVLEIMELQMPRPRAPGDPRSRYPPPGTGSAVPLARAAGRAEGSRRMMKRRSVLKLIAAPALMTVARPGFAQAKQKITYAYLLDPAYDAVTWAMSNGKVASDLITVEARGLAIPQLIQATSAKQYDVIMTAVIAIPPAAARGLELKVLSTALQQSPAGEGGGVWVKSDSPIRSPKELKGKTLGSYALRSTGYTQVRFALAP